MQVFSCLLARSLSCLSFSRGRTLSALHQAVQYHNLQKKHTVAKYSFICSSIPLIEFYNIYLCLLN